MEINANSNDSVVAASSSRPPSPTSILVSVVTQLDIQTDIQPPVESNDVCGAQVAEVLPLACALQNLPLTHSLVTFVMPGLHNGQWITKLGEGLMLWYGKPAAQGSGKFFF
ncbi:hypothetical protein [Candidatus Finniella inopinata]|uniref:Uncharacterized protein n=1 Tax=Candidatus Finniella inopinata TaxID=1696036 RepID=A0A4Q7DKY9_9PROT|nr:hypothetical protein [Candidatus Finniella inopinata]RZI46895.1 hypothetical protein EQU50_01335 [Candidatus Finniella inopinata]